MEHQNLDIFNTGLDETAKAYLLETTRWAKFLGIMILIGSAFAVLFALALWLFGARIGIYSGSELIVTFIYLIIMAALYIYPGIALYRFSAHIKRGIQLGSQELINSGLRYQKNFFRYLGILTILALSLLLLSIVFGGVAGLMYA